MDRVVRGVFIGFLGILQSFSLVGAVQQPQQSLSIPVGTVGKIVSRDEHQIRRAVVEKIVLFSPESEGSSSTLERNGILVRYPDAIATVLMCHGFMCDKHDQGFLRSIFPAQKYNFLTYDFRAHGEKAQGQFCSLGHLESLDVATGSEFAKNHPQLKDLPLIGYGFSMGSVAAIEAQARKSIFSAMILDCPFDSSANLLKRGLDRVKFSLFGYEFQLPGRELLQKYAFHPYIQSFVKVVLRAVTKLDPRNVALHVHPVEPVKSIEKVTVPSLFISCKNDDKVSIDAIKNIYQGSGASFKKLWLTNGRGHFDSYFYSPEKYTQEVRDFLDKVMQPVNKHAAINSQEIMIDVDDESITRRGT